MEGKRQSLAELRKMPTRTEVINWLLSQSNEDTSYLEIGVRDPNDNYSHIIATHKYSVDPGVEYKANPVDFKVTSDEFFEQLTSGTILSSKIRFDVIFVDGLHLAEQVDRDIANSLKYLKEDGFLVLHDCNPPSEWHARENFRYHFTPARGDWNGTTWKAFLKWRCDPSIQSCCIDTDWGLGILSKSRPIGESFKGTNQFFEFSKFSRNRRESLNLVSFEEFKMPIAD